MMLSSYFKDHMEPSCRHDPITSHDILSMDAYGSLRAEWRKAMIEIKKPRRVAVGPDITLYFENRLTLLWQIHEMLFIEGGGDEQLQDELRAYNPLVPKKNEYVATMMIEIPEIERRRILLQQWGHIERHVSLEFQAEKVSALYEEDIERTTADGKTSAVHFLRFPVTDEQKKIFLDAPCAQLRINHPYYSHTATLSDELLYLLRRENM